MKIKFIGAINEVTGSMTLLDTGANKFLVDSGLYQGTLETVKNNLNPLCFDPKEIKAIFLTHAHLDHSGFIPRLVKLGFRGAIFCTKPTVQLARLIMSDSAELMKKKDDNPMNDFYSTEHVGIAYGLFQSKKFNHAFNFLDLEITYLPAGHILGASSIQFIINNKTYVFSGDLGRSNDLLMPPPQTCPPADVVIMESTYGDRTRTGIVEEELSRFLKHVKKESKIGIIASFAVARSQMLITLIAQYYLKHPEEKVRVIMDGPMMSEANKIYSEHSDELNCPKELKYALGNVENLEHAREWESVQKSLGPLIIISSSGMVTGGRIWRHLINWHQDNNAIIFLPGFQSPGTPGHALKSGKREIHDDEGTKLRWSGEVWSSDAFSSHADQSELIEWTKNLSKDTTIYLNHGEETSKKALQKMLMQLGYLNCQMT